MLLSVDPTTPWTPLFPVSARNSGKMTASDVVGPDGIVYPDWTRAGVSGGIPDINNSAIRSTYTVYDVTTYGAIANDGQLDNAAISAARPLRQG